MKVDADTIAFIQKAAKTAQLVGIEGIIIEPNMVRAMHEDRTVIIIHTENVPPLPFGSIGIGRVDTFLSRYDVAWTLDKFEMEAIVDEKSQAAGSPFATSLKMKAKGTKIDYRCADPARMKAPLSKNDTPKNRVKLNGEAVLLMQRGVAAMNADTISIISNNGVSFEIADVNTDKFSYSFADDAEPLTDDTDTKFAWRYPAKILLSIFKTGVEGSFEIGSKGILGFPVNGLTVYVLPQA